LNVKTCAWGNITTQLATAIQPIAVPTQCFSHIRVDLAEVGMHNFFLSPQSHFRNFARKVAPQPQLRIFSEVCNFNSAT
jgi:hypothetical protein